MPKEAKESKRKVKKKSKGKFYFNQDTENEIVRFQQEQDLEKRKEIFVRGIQPAFKKLIENLIFVYGFQTLDDMDVLKNDCMSYLFERIELFNVEKGSKAFSYFNVVGRNFFIQKGKVHKRKKKSDIHLDKTLLSKLEKADNEAVVMSFEDDVLKEEFITLLKDEMKKWRGKFEKDQERRVLEAVILIFNNPDLIDIYKKKGVYVFLREITDLNTKQIVTNLTKLKKKYHLFKERYHGGKI